MEATETILASVCNTGSRRGNKVLGILTLREVQHLEKADPNPRGAMEVRCSVLTRTMLSVVELTMESVDRACYGCGKSGHMVRDCPQNRGQAGGNAQPRPNP